MVRRIGRPRARRYIPTQPEAKLAPNLPDWMVEHANRYLASGGVRLWKKALEFWPPYADYQLKTEREIPVVVMDPVQAAR
jgi:hypothetical protein